MKKEIAKKWVAALRSGKYKQGRRALHENGKFCCLGVLCDLHRQEVGGEWLPSVPDADSLLAFVYRPNTDSNGESKLVPFAVSQWAGMSDRACAFGSPYIFTRCLSYINDHQRENFEEIANFIEKHYEDM